MLELRLGSAGLNLLFNASDLRPRHISQLTFWGFHLQEECSAFFLVDTAVTTVLPKLIAYFQREALLFQVDEQLDQLLEVDRRNRALLKAALERAEAFKVGSLDKPEAKGFLQFLSQHIPRKLKDHQIKASLHLLAAYNGANFSVPGSGKTTVVLAVFAQLRRLSEIDALFVVGPPSCFAPWQEEYHATLGVRANCRVLAGGDVDDRRSQYHVNRDSASDLYLTSFQTLQNDWPHVVTLFKRQGVRFLFVVDEAHYIKQLGGVWAEAVLAVAKEATRRCVLTGTPFPRALSDAFNLFDVLWPTFSPISDQDRHRIERHIQRKEHSSAVKILDSDIGPLFYRVRKNDLGLAEQVFHEPIRLEMKKHERHIYNSILDRVRAASMDDYLKNLDILIKLRRGRMTRLRQCISYAALLASAVTEYSEDLTSGNLSITDLIKQYDTMETPAKIDAALGLIKDITGRGEKIVVWSNFIGTLKLLVQELEDVGCVVGLIYGSTPFERVGVTDESSREGIIRTFCDARQPMNVLVANPAACAESISLHKVCSHALYYDMSYNCAQYLQSLDRIHRVGGSEDKESHYYFLQYTDSIDSDILGNVRTKARNMSEVIDKEYPMYSLDMFAEDEELEAYERLFVHRE